MVVGLLLAALLVLLGVGAGLRQARTLGRVRDEPYMPDEDKRYFRKQARRRLVISALLLAVGAMIAAYYLTGWDARMDAIPDRARNDNPGGEPDPQAEDDKAFTKFVGGYWIVVILLLGAAVCVSVADFWATRTYWMARFREIKSDHETKLQRDLAVYRQQRLNERAKGLKKPDDTTPDADPPA